MLAQYLGPSFNIGPAMTEKLLKENEQYAYMSTYRQLTEEKLVDPPEIKARERFDIAINEKLEKYESLKDYDKEELDADTPELPHYEDEQTGPSVPLPGREDIDDDHYDQYIGSNVSLPLGDGFKTDKVTSRKRNTDGKVMGTAHSNPILDSREYTVELPDGVEDEHFANIIAEIMYY